MSASSTIGPHDFEIVDSPVEASVDAPADPTPTPTADDAKSIKELFDQNGEPLLIQTLAKAGIFLSLPHQITWSVATAIFVALCQPAPSENIPMDQIVFKQITLHTEDRLNQTRKRLEWVDKELPAVVERYNNHISGAVKQVKTAKDEAFVQATPIVARSSHILLYLAAAPFVLSFFFSCISWFRAPLWIWLGLGYWIGKRRERYASSQGRFSRHFGRRAW